MLPYLSAPLTIEDLYALRRHESVKEVTLRAGFIAAKGGPPASLPDGCHIQRLVAFLQ
jgi:hypothetical protein